MVSALDSGSSGLGSSVGQDHCVGSVLWLDTSPSQCLSPPRSINGYRQQNAGG